MINTIIKYSLHYILYLHRFKKIKDFIEEDWLQIPVDTKELIKTCIEKRVDVCTDDCHCLATALHPRYGVTYLSRNQIEQAMTAMESLADRMQLNKGDLYYDYGLFTVRGGHFRMERAEAAIDYMSAALWWAVFHGQSPLSKV
jgi:hypothetical protein